MPRWKKRSIHKISKRVQPPSKVEKKKEISKKRTTLKRPKYQDDQADPTRGMPSKTFNTGREFTGTLFSKGVDATSATKKRGMKRTLSAEDDDATSTAERGSKRTKISSTEHIEKDRTLENTNHVAGDNVSTNTTTNTNTGEFTSFPKLPTELRWRIWELAAETPRLVRWGHHPPPGIFHACTESRKIALQKTSKLIKRNLYRRLDYCFYLTPQRDILYHLTPLPSIATMQAERKRFLPLMNSGVKRLALPLDDAFKAARDVQPIGMHPLGTTNGDNLWVKLNKLFPDLEELIVFVFPNMKRGDEIEDFRVIDFHEVERTGDLSVLTTHQYNMMRVIRDKYDTRIATGEKVVDRLTFVKKLSTPEKHCTEILEA